MNERKECMKEGIMKGTNEGSKIERKKVMKRRKGKREEGRKDERKKGRIDERTLSIQSVRSKTRINGYLIHQFCIF